MNDGTKVTAQPGTGKVIALSQSILDLISKVVKKTKLRKAERVDVARELTSHFQEALVTGKQPDEAIQKFGDVNESARTLRAAAIAKRNPIDRALGQTCMWSMRAVAVLVIAYAVVAVYFNTQSRVVSFDPIKRYSDSLPVAKSPDQAAWTGIRDALIAMGLGRSDPRRESTGVTAVLDKPLPSDELWTEAAGWVASNQPQIAALQAATKRSIFGYPTGSVMTEVDRKFFGIQSFAHLPTEATVNDIEAEIPFLGLVLPQLSSMRTATRILATDMVHAVEMGDGERATRDAESMIALSIHVQEGRMLIGDLVGMSIRSMTVNNILMVLEWKPKIFNDTQLQRLQIALRSVPLKLERPDFTTERIMYEDLVQRFYTDDGHGDGWFAPTWKFIKVVQLLESVSGVAGIEKKRNNPSQLVALGFLAVGRPFGVYMVAGRKESNEKFDEFSRRFEGGQGLSLREVVAAGIQNKDDFQSMIENNSTRWLLLRFIMSTHAKVALDFRIDQEKRNAAVVAIAAEQFYRANGKWPASANDLASLCNGKAPHDPWCDKPIMMASNADGFRMWSVGRDEVNDQGNLNLFTPSILGGKTGQRASAIANVPIEQGQQSVDWVWFAPRGNTDRWVEKQ